MSARRQRHQTRVAIASDVIEGRHGRSKCLQIGSVRVYRVIRDFRVFRDFRGFRDIRVTDPIDPKNTEDPNGSNRPYRP